MLARDFKWIKINLHTRRYSYFYRNLGRRNGFNSPIRQESFGFEAKNRGSLVNQPNLNC